MIQNYNETKRNVKNVRFVEFVPKKQVLKSFPSSKCSLRRVLNFDESPKVF